MDSPAPGTSHGPLRVPLLVAPRRLPLTHLAPVIAPLLQLAAARATVEALKDMAKGELEQVPLQDYF